MAKVSYIESIADYVIVKFRCKCGHEITTDLVPVKERYDFNKNINSFNHNNLIVCKECNESYLLHFYDDMYHSYCEIPSLIDDKSIIYLHEIPCEYAEGHNNAWVDYIEEIIKIKEFLDDTINSNNIEKKLLLRMAFIYVISLMDAFLHKTFTYYICKYDVFKQDFFKNINPRCIKINERNILSKINTQSFQNLDLITIPYFKNAFGIEIPQDNIIQNAVSIRNAIVHNNSRERDGYLYEVSEFDVKEIVAHIESLVKFVNVGMLDVLYDKITLPNTVRY